MVRLDFLTVTHRGGEEPYPRPGLQIPLQPLKFMEFSLENVQPATKPWRPDARLAGVARMTPASKKQ